MRANEYGRKEGTIGKIWVMGMWGPMRDERNVLGQC